MSRSRANRSAPNEEEIDPLWETREMLHAARETYLDQLNQNFVDLNNEELWSAFTTTELRARRDQLQRLFAEMEKVHILYRECCILASNQVFLDAEAKLYRAMAKIEARLRELGQREHLNIQSTPISASRRLTFGAYETTNAANSTLNVDGQQVIRVETARRPQIGTFSGKTAEWPAFRDLFIAEVHNRSYDPVTKLHYLREACTGEASRTLGAWQPTAANYQLAWETMMAAYNDEYHVIHGILADLHSVRKQEKESYSALRTILDSMNSGMRQLSSITSLATIVDQMWIHHAKQRLPASTLDAWEQFRNQQRLTTLPTFEDFRLFVDSKAKARREFEYEDTLVPREKSSTAKHEFRERRSQVSSGSNRFKPYDKVKPEPRKSANESFGHAPPTQCIMTNCDQIHYLGQCQEFQKLSFADKMDVVREHRLCRCCLATGHMALNCKRSSCTKCPGDKNKHHFRLCTKAVQFKQNPPASSKPQLQSQ